MSSTMSTRIEDLPEAPPNEIPTPNDTNQSNITVNMKKKVSFSDKNEYQSASADKSFMDIMKAEISEENFVLVIVLLAAALPSFSVYVQNLPVVGTYAATDFSTSLLKAGILLIVYIISKHFLIPRFKV